MAGEYDKQDRGEASAYDAYLAQMDASMRQKVALTAAHLLCEGQVADMGMGSGSGSYALAKLYPELQVIGVDIDPEMVARARERYRLPNLCFVEGDIARRCFEPGYLEAILDSSVLHHVTSYGGYDREAAAEAMRVQSAELSEDGVLVVRDFVDPGPGEVWLDVRSDDGEGDDPRTCSSAALFERFGREFRFLRPPGERGFSWQRVEPTATCPLEPGFARYQTSHAHAVEYVLRKDYRESWGVEVQEEYLYATQDELEAVCARLGLRVLCSTPIHNPWIVEHRFRGQIRLWHTDGTPLDYPATNYVIVGQKVRPGAGVRIREGAARAPLGYLELGCYRRDDGRVFDLVRRPNVTVDVLPWFEAHESLYVLARQSYPRPILGSEPRGSEPLDGAHAVTYVSEPLNVQQRDKPLGQTVDELLATIPGGADILGFEQGGVHYPSPGGLQEEVRSVLVRIAPVNVRHELGGGSGFSTSGTLRAIEARQLLRAAQVGGLPDARLELNTYELLLRQGMAIGEWIGQSISLQSATDKPGNALPVTALESLATRPHRRRFRPVAREASPGFLVLRCADFEELDAAGRTVAREPRELVYPAGYSDNTVAVAVLARSGGRVVLGVDDDDLPAAQCFVGGSELLVAPAWRVPHAEQGLSRARAFARGRLEQDYGLSLAPPVWELGGRYHPSPGVTPEVVYPIAVEVTAVAPASRRSLVWVDLARLVEERAMLRDGHLRLVALRAAHAVGLLA